jgi:hypothetical protein
MAWFGTQLDDNPDKELLESREQSSISSEPVANARGIHSTLPGSYTKAVRD